MRPSQRCAARGRQGNSRFRSRVERYFELRTVVLPCYTGSLGPVAIALGISTCFTGGEKYDRDDIRFAFRNDIRFCRCHVTHPLLLLNAAATGRFEACSCMPTPGGRLALGVDRFTFLRVFTLPLPVRRSTANDRPRTTLCASMCTLRELGDEFSAPL